MAISRILSADCSFCDDHLSRCDCSQRPRTMPAVMDHRYRTHDATIPEDRRTGCPTSVLSCTTWGFSCLVDCSASGELLPRLFTLTCASLPKNRRCLFCDTFRQPRLAPGLPACFTRHAAVWCSDFPLASIAALQRSSAIAPKLPQSSSRERPPRAGKDHDAAPNKSGVSLCEPWLRLSRFLSRESQAPITSTA